MCCSNVEFHIQQKRHGDGYDSRWKEILFETFLVIKFVVFVMKSPQYNDRRDFKKS